jgi:hypothetical protein
MSMESGALSGIIPNAVDEVGGPTILATFTVIAAPPRTKPCEGLGVRVGRSAGR